MATCWQKAQGKESPETKSLNFYLQLYFTMYMEKTLIMSRGLINGVLTLLESIYKAYCLYQLYIKLLKCRNQCFAVGYSYRLGSIIIRFNADKCCLTMCALYGRGKKRLRSWSKFSGNLIGRALLASHSTCIQYTYHVHQKRGYSLPWNWCVTALASWLFP